MRNRETAGVRTGADEFTDGKRTESHPQKGLGGRMRNRETAGVRTGPDGFTDGKRTESHPQKGLGGRMRNWNRRKTYEKNRFITWRIIKNTGRAGS